MYGCVVCWAGIYVSGNELRCVCGRDIIYELPGGQEEDHGGVVGVVWDGDVGGGEHESLFRIVSKPYHILGDSNSYPVARLDVSPVYRLHDAALLVGDIAHPIRLARRNHQMRAETLHMSVQLLRLVNFEFARVLDAAAVAVAQTLVAIYSGVGGGE